MNEILTRFGEMTDEITMIKERVQRARSRGERKLVNHLTNLLSRKKLGYRAYRADNFVLLYGNQRDYSMTCNCGSGEFSWREYDGQGIYLCRVCDQCRQERLSCYRPEILAPYNQEDVDEPIDPEM